MTFQQTETQKRKAQKAQKIRPCNRQDDITIKKQPLKISCDRQNDIQAEKSPENTKM